MNNKPTPWVDPADQQLNELVAAASAPGTDAELRNEEHSVAMFQMAHLESLTRRRESMSPTPRTNRIAARTVAAGIAAFVLATTGIALAATGNLPGNGRGNGPSNGLGNDESGQIVESESPVENEQGEDEQGEDEQGVDEQGDSSSDEVTDETEGVDAAGTPPVEAEESTHQGFRGLCRAITVGNKAEQGNALEAPPFVALIEAAGGVENVEAYCAERFGSKALPDKTDRPEKPEKPEKPAKADKPDKREHPTKPVKGQNPDRPGKPEHPEKP